MPNLTFPTPSESPAAEALRAQVRDFLARTIGTRTPVERAESWNAYDREFSRAIGAQGWLGMTWPRAYGGHERTAFERYVVVEELLAAGAPVASHWVADRQSGPTLLKYGTELQKHDILPRIVTGDATFCIGMSEPDSGSDLAAFRTRAVPVRGGWRVTGTKLWTTYAHKADYMILFCRTSGDVSDRQAGASQLLIDMAATDGVTVRPILDLSGEHHFNEVHFEDAFVPEEALIGVEGEGWSQVMSELAFERSGPERFLSSIQLLIELVRCAQSARNANTVKIGQILAHLVVLRQLSRGVAVMLERGEDPALQAAIVKDLGASFEQSLPEIARELIEVEPDERASASAAAVMARITLNAPAFSLRGGTREILRGIIAKGLGLR